MKTAVIMFSMGGPADQIGVRPFLFNLFNDRAIIPLGQPWRWLLARLISGMRAKHARQLYAYMGGGSPLLAETRSQAAALERQLKQKGEYRTFVAMRYAAPRAQEVLQEVLSYQPDSIILLPMYPQFSTTTSQSSMNEWLQLQQKTSLKSVATRKVCCHYWHANFIEAHAKNIESTLQKLLTEDNKNIKILFSAHSLPQRVIDAGDPYEKQMQQTVAMIVERTGIEQQGIDYTLCYQSKVGRLPWLGPETEQEIAKASQQKKDILVIPIAFVSEHIETLVELDIEYKELAINSGANSYHRLKTLRDDETYIAALRDICLNKVQGICCNKCPYACSFGQKN